MEKDYYRSVWDQSIISAFVQQVNATPLKTAIVYQEKKLTYQQLDQLSSTMAAAIAKVSFVPLQGQILAVALDRSIWPVVAFLAALKSGAAYLPIDPSQPDARLQYMLRDSEACLLLTSEEHQARQNCCQETILEDIDWKIPADFQQAIPDNPLAYIMYTSGSSGEPKGVKVRQRGILRLVLAAQPFQITSDTVMAQSGNIAFDASTFEIWGALLNGATLAIIPYESVLDSSLLAAEINRHGITDAWFTVALFNQLASDDPCLFGRINNVLVGGDALNPEIIKKVLNSATPPATLWNGYGPTENTVFTTLHRIVPEDCERASIPIGKAIAGTQCYILDEQRHPVKMGQIGELYTSGAGIAEGYLNKPDKTAETFLPNPFYAQEKLLSPDSASDILYRTGDRVRELAGAILEFIGRTDNQVKIRGYRLEPGEIEQTLCRLNGVSQAVVKVFQHHGQKQLAAWCVSALPPREIIQALREQLPAWMVPSSLQTLTHFPLNANGKIDKNRLPAAVPDSSDHTLIETETQSYIAKIWQEILKLPSCPGQKDDFFLLGGHSLLAVRVQQQLRQRLQKAVSLSQLFRYSELAALAEFVDSLTPDEQDSLTRLYQPGQSVPLTPEQLCLWMDSQSEAESAKHHFCCAWRIEGDFNPQRLESALQALIARHDSLRLRIYAKNGVPYQLVSDEPFRLVVRQVDSEAMLQQKIARQVNRPFYFSHEPLMRVRLYQTCAHAWALIIVFHHIIIDGWSMGNFYRELECLYRGRKPQAPLPVQFTDYCLWRAKQMTQNDVGYWNTILDGVKPLMFPKSDTSKPTPQTLHVTLSAELHQRLLRRVENSHTGLYTLFYSALTLLLSRYCNQQEIPLAGIWANRPFAALEPQIGFFANTLILYTHIDEQQTVTQCLKKHHQQLMEGFGHGAAPLYEVLANNPLPRTGGVHPLCMVTLVLQNTEGGDGRNLKLPDCQITSYPLPPEPAKCAMLVNILPAEDGCVEIEIKVCQSLLPQSLIKKLPLHYHQMIEAFSTHTGKLQEIPTILPEERLQLLGWNLSTTPPSRGTVLSHFQHQVQIRPDSVAVRYLDTSLTWGEIDRLSDALAWQLRERCGELRGKRIVLALNRCLHMPVAMLAVIKTGAAYVPFDPVHPVGRLLYILKDSAAHCVIVQPGCADQQQICHEVVLTPEIFPPKEGRFPSAKLVPEDILNIIYTSGSTGEPKGVRVMHKGIVRLVMNSSPWHVAADTVITQIGNIAFDVSSLEIWGALLNGACLAIIPYETVIDSKALQQALKKYGVTDSAITVALFNQLSEENPDFFSGIHNLIIGGESPNAQLIGNVLRSASPPAQIWNAYGPTENSVTTTMHPISLADCESGILPIGKPIPETSCYILSSSGQLQPVGVVGELYTSGSGVAAGYLNSQEKSKAVFLPNPFYRQTHCPSSVTESMYKTGDLACWREDGSLIFMGRTDNQIKIRGFRLETDEVIQHLCGLPGVTQAIVTKADGPSGAQLVAWCVSVRSSASILQELRRLIPAYMVPATLYVTERFPLTANGKIDQKRLSETTHSPSSSGLTPCVTSTEQALAQIWNQLLGLTQPICREQNFFDLGGHSLIVIRMVTLIKEKLNKTLEVETVFQAHDLAELADVIDGKQPQTIRNTMLAQRERDARLARGSFLTRANTDFHTLLLTGATGFFGLYLLAELQRQLPDSRILCLVRFANKAEAVTRLQQEAAHYQLSLDFSATEMLTGDLNSPHLGINEKTWRYLADNVDAVYHCGAKVNHLHNYSALRSDNVCSTLELLSLCQQGRAKQMFYVSTLSAAAQSSTHILENTLAAEINTDNGYVQSKWVSERLMVQAFQQGLKGSIYRMGNITGSRQNGMSNIEQNHVLNMIKGCLQQGVAPDWDKWTIDFSPVDVLAQLLVTASLQHKKREMVNLGFLSAISWKTLLIRIAQSEHCPLTFVPPEEWTRDWLPQIDSSNALYPFRSFYLEPCDPQSLITEHAWVDESAVILEPDSLLETYLCFWKKIGFFAGETIGQ